MTKRRSLEQRLHNNLAWVATEPHRRDWLRYRAEWDSAFAREYGFQMPDDMRSFALWKQREQEGREALRRFLDSWVAARSDFAEWLKANPDLNRLLVKALNERFTTLEPEAEGRARIMWVRPHLPGYLESPKWIACEGFIDLVTDDFYKSLCKCHRCGNYYLNTTRRRRKVYCSRRCGSIATAVQSVRRRREEARREQIERVAAAIRVCGQRHDASDGDWKTWVSRQASVTRKWLPRAVNKGDVQAPPENRRESNGNI